MPTAEVGMTAVVRPLCFFGAGVAELEPAVMSPAPVAATEPGERCAFGAGLIYF